MNQPVDRIDRFIQDLLNAAARDERLIRFGPDTTRSQRLEILVTRIIACEKRLRAIEKSQPDALEPLLTRAAFSTYATELGGGGPSRVHARPEAPEGEATAEGNVLRGLRDLAQHDPTFFANFMATLRRGATPQQQFYVGVLEDRCKGVPRPTYRELEERFGVRKETLRVGVLRLRAKAQYAIVLHLHGSTVAEFGEEALAKLRRAWRERRHRELALLLETLRVKYDDDPSWRLYAGLEAHERGERDEAGLHWSFGLMVGHDAGTRAKLLSNQGCAEHARGDHRLACQHWLAAFRLDPGSPFPLLNLAKHFVEARVPFFWTWALKELAKLRGDPERRGVIDDFLATCPAFERVSRTSDWRRGPAGWIREREAEGAALPLREISRRNPAGAGALLPGRLLRRAA